MFHFFVVTILRPIFKIVFKMKSFGTENFPRKGAFIVAPNHVSFLDPIVVGLTTPSKLTYLARESLFRFKPFGKMLNWLHVYSLKREGAADFKAFKLALNELKKGKPILVFPEGTRSEDGDFKEPKLGIGFLQVMTGVDILPCYVKGSWDAWPRGAKFPKPGDVSIYYGKPIKFENKFSCSKKERYANVAEKVMSEIKRLRENAS